MSLLRRRIYPERLNGRVAAGGSRRCRPRRGRPPVVWRLSDGKPGHDSQSCGLVEALQRLMPLEVHELSVRRAGVSLQDLLRCRFAAGSRLPDPWLMVGAGRATQLPLLAARRARRGRAVVLMTPEFPRAWFDLCVIPGHDRPLPAANVLVTRGCLNRVQHLAWHGPRHAMLMIGGPSRHFHWDGTVVLEQVARVAHDTPPQRWVLATSRRTPAGFGCRAAARLARRGHSVSVIEDSAPQRLAERLVRARCVWVTEDSVSMVYESLTAGVSTGLLRLEPRGTGRVVDGNRQLLASGAVTAFGDWCAGMPLRPPSEPFREADRAARWICERWEQEATRP